MCIFSAASNFHSLQRICPAAGIPLVEALTRKEMSRVMNKFPYVGVIGILDYTSCEVIKSYTINTKSMKSISRKNSMK